MNRIHRCLLIGMAVVISGCSQPEAKVSSESSIVEGTKSVVNETADALRNAVKGVNDAVYGAKK